MIRREVPTKNLHRGEKEKAGGSMIRQVISLQMALSSDTAKQIVKFLKDKSLRKFKHPSSKSRYGSFSITR